MIISVTGKSRHNKTLIKKAADFFITQLIKKKIKKKLNIKIQLVDKPLKNYTDKWIIMGICIPLTFASTPRKFAIRLNKRTSTKILLRTLAHEITHIKQYASGNLRPIDWSFMTDIYRWKGKVRDIPYYRSPWEVEARQMESVLYKKFLTAMKEESTKPHA